MGVVGTSTLVLDFLFAIIVFVLIEIIYRLVRLRDRIEEKYGKKPIKIIRIIYFSILLIIALFFGYKYLFRPLVLHMDCETILDETQPDLIEELSYVKVKPNVVVSSSERSPSTNGSSRFDASMAIDNDLHTSWCTQNQGKGAVGDWIRLTYDTPITVSAITVWPGNWSDDSLKWKLYAPMALTVSLFLGNRKLGEQYVSIVDRSKKCITIILSKPTEIDSVRVLIERVEIQSGGLDRISHYVAISEISVYEKGSLSYVTASHQITDEAIEKMKSKAEDDYAARIAESWGSGEKLQSFTYLGYYFLTKKKPSLGDRVYDSLIRKRKTKNGDANEIILIYRCDVTCDGQPFTYYHFIRFENLMVNDDGACFVNTDDYDTPSKKLITDYGYYYYGYGSLDDLFNSCVKQKASSYTLEDKVND